MHRIFVTIALATFVGVLGASCTQKSSTPPKRTSSAVATTDPVNAYPDYYAISQSKECRVLGDRWDLLNDPSWRPDTTTIERLDRVRAQIDLVIAASNLPRCDRVVQGASASMARSINGSEIGIARGLLRVEVRRLIASNTHDDAAECVAALCRMAVQVRSRDGIMESAVQNSTMGHAITEAAPLDLSKLSMNARGHLLDALERLDSERMYEGVGTDEQYQSDFKAKKLKLAEQLKRFRAASTSTATPAPPVGAK